MICVDSSVAVKWVFVESLSEEALALVHAAYERGEEVIAPPLLRAEATNVVYTKSLALGVDLAVARQWLDLLLSFPVRVVSRDDLHDRALTLAHELGLRGAYDAHYLALAELAGCEFWTADRRLVERVDNRLPFVRWLADAPPGP